MNFVALLRGINVGGKNLIKMADLRENFEKQGFTNVKTYINSGNVIFSSTERNTEKLEKKIEKFLNLTVVVLSESETKQVISKVPKAWTTNKDLRCYVAFLKRPLTSQEAIKEFDTKEGIDTVDSGPGVVYMTTQMSGLTKSRFSKLASKSIYKQITIRNFRTTQKILELMSEQR